MHQSIAKYVERKIWATTLDSDLSGSSLPSSLLKRQLLASCRKSCIPVESPRSLFPPHLTEPFKDHGAGGGVDGQDVDDLVCSRAGVGLDGEEEADLAEEAALEELLGRRALVGLRSPSRCMGRPQGLSTPHWMVRKERSREHPRRQSSRDGPPPSLHLHRVALQPPWTVRSEDLRRQGPTMSQAGIALPLPLTSTSSRGILRATRQPPASMVSRTVL